MAPSLRMASLIGLIFLDYDGVLQTPKRQGWQNFELLPRFERVLRDHPNVGVVIASTHRLEEELEDLLWPYSHDVQRQIVGATPDLPCGNAAGGRYIEIEQWRADAGLTHLPWVALDDLPRLYPPSLAQLLVCDPLVGFGPAVELALRNRLQTF